jgi:hypothetical protein
MCERARVSHNHRVPRKAQIAALLPALFLEDYIFQTMRSTYLTRAKGIAQAELGKRMPTSDANWMFFGKGATRRRLRSGLTLW